MATSPIGLKDLSESQMKAYKTFQTNANVRLISSEQLVRASNYFELNEKFFEANKEAIRVLVDSMAQVNEIIAKLIEDDGDAGKVKVVREERGFFCMKEVTKEESAVSVNEQIQTNLGKPEVVLALRTLGILPQEQAPVFERPSNSTIAKAGVGAAGLAASGAGIYYSNEIGAGIASAYRASPEFIQTAGDYVGRNAKAAYDFAASYMPSMPGKDNVKNFFSSQWENMKSGASTTGQFIMDNKWAVGGGAAVALVGGALIYRALKDSENEEATAQAPVATPVVD